MTIDTTTQPPLLPADVTRVLADGRPTPWTLDQELAQAGWYARSVTDLQTQVTEVSSTTDGNTAAITEEKQARTDKDRALAEDIDTVSTTVGANTAKIATLQQSYDGLAVNYTIRGTLGGQSNDVFVVDGATQADGSAVYGIAFSASSFALNDPNLPAGTQSVFEYSTALRAFTFNVPVAITRGNFAAGAVSVAVASSGSIGNTAGDGFSVTGTFKGGTAIVIASVTNDAGNYYLKPIGGAPVNTRAYDVTVDSAVLGTMKAVDVLIGASSIGGGGYSFYGAPSTVTRVYKTTFASGARTIALGAQVGGVGVTGSLVILELAS